MADAEIRRRRVVRPAEEEISTEPATINQDGGSSSLSFLIKLGLFLLTISAIGYLRSPLDPVAFDWPPEVDLGGVKVIDLAKGKRILEGLVGPESMEVDEDGSIYTGLLDGRIIKINPSKTGEIGEGTVEDIWTKPIPGVNPVDGHTKPRPLGLRLHDKKLYVIDAYYGLYSIDLETREVRPLVKPNDVEPSMKFPNDLDITKDGKYIYFTDTSHKWNLEELYSDVIEGTCTGRLFRHAVQTGKTRTLSSKLCFANGVQLSVDEKTVAVTETSRCRVLFFDVETWYVTSVTPVPSLPDNIRRSKNGGYWVAMPIKRSYLQDYTRNLPVFRKIFTGIVPPWIGKNLANTKEGSAVELSPDGDIVNVLLDKHGQVSSTVSEICETKDGTLLAGSYKEGFMVKFKR